MSEKSWASLAPLLDYRRSVESIVAGITIHADREFRCCVTMNEDESTFEIPDYILSRLHPTLAIGFPEKNEEMAILRYHLPFADDEILSMTVAFLTRSHELNLDFSPRDGIQIVRYALKRLSQDKGHPLSKDRAWGESVEKVLGEEALDLDKLADRKKEVFGDAASQSFGLGDFFFGEEDPLNPDR